MPLNGSRALTPRTRGARQLLRTRGARQLPRTRGARQLPRTRGARPPRVVLVDLEPYTVAIGRRGREDAASCRGREEQDPPGWGWWPRNPSPWLSGAATAWSLATATL